MKIAAVFSAMIVLASCSPLAPLPERSNFYLLSSIKDSGTGTSPTSGAPDPQVTLGLGPISFPDYLLRPEVVTRTGPNRIDLSEENRWGEPLDKNFTRVLSENLESLLNTHRIEQYPWNRRDDIDYQILVDVQRFDTSSDGNASLVANWIIKDGRSGKILLASATNATTAAPSADTGRSAALSSDLETMSRQIAAQITELSSQKKPAST